MPVVRKIFRRRRGDSESEEDEQDSEEVRLKLEETREVQNLRKRPNGVRWVLRREEEAGTTDTSASGSLSQISPQT
ncbi:PREDICTED: uncharacterized protein C9orf78-like [Colobus angolensis palliatus]|uniref:uncharacterized protein C9orf78-like n=1 Tax=Colobus angolensis palliatus TaxID=336983 RepID=UPI0005F3FDD4|nr:PREDICTED: uncharacterized protein C9orf78-like [Colobus angolensis palliatus]